MECVVEEADSLTFDFSHASTSGMNVIDFFEHYYDKVKMIHLTDGVKSITKTKDEHLLPGEGDMPIREVFSLLRDKNWLGRTALEVNTRKFHSLDTKREPLAYCLDYFKKITVSNCEVSK